MRIRLAAALLALPLLAFDCGGEEPPTNPFGLSCKLEVRGAVTEDLWCIVVAHDYSQDPMPSSEWVFMLTAYQTNLRDVGAGVGVFLGGRPSLGVPYGWSGGGASNVTSGSAQRYAGSLFANPPTHVETHSAVELVGTGALSVTFTQIPPIGAVGEQSLAVHGTLSGTLPAVDGVGGPVTFAATF